MNTLVERYAQMRDMTRVHERALFASPRIPSELELQARWFAGDFGKHFVSIGGDKIDIIQFGTWNREAGPDFREAAIRMNGGEPIPGCIEIDLLDRSWETHGHATNPAFEATVLHVFVERTDRAFFTRTQSNRNVTQVCIDPVTLPEASNAHVPLARPGRCQAPLKDLPEERVYSVLDAAAQFRLRQKANRIRNKIDAHGRDETLFQEIAAALGYKENKLPFTLLAQRLPLHFLRENARDCEALLFGGAGFLEMPDLDAYKKSPREYVRQLWDSWWPHRDELQRFMLPANTWRLSSTRPVNHPQRRLAALATSRAIGRGFSVPQARIAWRSQTISFRRSNIRFGIFITRSQPLHRRREWHSSVTRASPISWQTCCFHFGWHTMPTPQLPQAHLCGRNTQSCRPNYRIRRLETATTRLFGNDSRGKGFLETVAHQQGLLQIYEDFCMQDNSDCAQCPFLEQMAKWK